MARTKSLNGVRNLIVEKLLENQVFARIERLVNVVKECVLNVEVNGIVVLVNTKDQQRI